MRHVVPSISAFCLALLAWIAMVPPAAAGEIHRADPDLRIDGEYLVMFNKGVDAQAMAAQTANLYRGQVGAVYEHALSGALMMMDDADAQNLVADPNVAWVEENAVIPAQLVPSEPKGAGPSAKGAGTQPNPPSYGLDRIDQRDLPLDGSYRFAFTGAGVTLYIIDSGIRPTHNDFGGRASIGVDTVAESTDGIDCFGHGTHVAAIAGGTTFGVAKEADIVAVRISNCAGRATNAAAIAGFDWVAANAQTPAVANISLSAPGSEMVDAAVAGMVAAGVFTTVSAGNNDTTVDSTSPQRSSTVFVVGASTANDRRASFSNFGDIVKLYAPGDEITSAWHTSDSASRDVPGTSQAAPHVAGAAALILEEHPQLTPAQVRDELLARATLNVILDLPNQVLEDLLYTLDDPASNQPPTAAFTPTCDGLDCTFDGGGSSDPDGTIASYQWTFPGGATANGETVSFFLPGYGSHPVTLTVMDDDGAAASTTQNVQATESDIAPRVGAWFNPQRSGNGFELFRAPNGQYVLFWYTFLPSGEPTWYTSALGPKGLATWQQPLRESRWHVNPSGSGSSTNEVVGHVRLDLSDDGTAWFSWSLQGQTGGERFQFLFGGQGRSGAWFDSAESGWGIQIQETGSTLGTVIAIYDGSLPRWVLGTADNVPPQNGTIPVHWATGLGLCPSCTGTNTGPLPRDPAGTVTLSIASGAATTGTASTAIVLPSGARWDRANLPITLLTEP